MMNMTLTEVIAWLTELQKVCPEGTGTNVTAVRLKGMTSLDYGERDPYSSSYRRTATRARDLSVWVDSYIDGPEAGSPCSVRDSTGGNNG